MKPEYIIWHCSDSAWGTVGAIRGWHLAQGWADIGYHGVILNGVLTADDEKKGRRVAWLDGSFQLGRIWNGDGSLEGAEVGAHAYGFNSDSLGLCLIGRAGQFTERQISTALSVTEMWMAQFGVSVAHVIGHYEIGLFRPQYATSKTCPGIDMGFVREALRAGRDLMLSVGGK